MVGSDVTYDTPSNGELRQQLIGFLLRHKDIHIFQVHLGCHVSLVTWLDKSEQVYSVTKCMKTNETAPHQLIHAPRVLVKPDPQLEHVQADRITRLTAFRTGHVVTWLIVHAIIILPSHEQFMRAFFSAMSLAPTVMGDWPRLATMHEIIVVWALRLATSLVGWAKGSVTSLCGWVSVHPNPKPIWIHTRLLTSLGTGRGSMTWPI